MICVSIARGRHKQMIAEHRHLVEQGAKLVELRLDYIRRTVDLKRLIANRPGPVIATCRRQEDGGMWEGTEPQRLMLLRAAIIEGLIAGGVTAIEAASVGVNWVYAPVADLDSEPENPIVQTRSFGDESV